MICNIRLYRCIVAALISNAAQAQQCPDLSGTYSFNGEWISITPTDQSNPQRQWPPNITRDAFLYSLSQVVKPKYVLVHKGQVPDSFQINVLEPEQILPNAQGLSHLIKLDCKAGKWSAQKSVSGGGENTPSTTNTNILIATSNDGDLIAEGEQTISMGWILKDTQHWKWQAVFRNVKPSE